MKLGDSVEHSDGMDSDQEWNNMNHVKPPIENERTRRDLEVSLRL
jgi:hypothetical protein